jgi:hypothetical protein
VGYNERIRGAYEALHVTTRSKLGLVPYGVSRRVGRGAIVQVVIDYPRDRETVVMSLMEVLGEIKGQDPGPKGLLRGPAYQIFESDGTLVQTQFVLNPDF